jgi:hypothetical protein
MIILKGSLPVRWEKTYYVDSIDQAKEIHEEIYPDYIIEESIEAEDSVWRNS